MKKSLFGLVVFTLLVTNARSQSTFGSILGSVQDQSGAVVPGVSIEITNLDTQATRSATSNGAGQYSILNLLEGRYLLVATKSGFSATRVEQITLEAREERRVDLTMGVSATTQSIQVEAVATAMNTENATIAQAIGNTEVNSLPLNYRGNTTSPLAAIDAMPNVQQDSNGNISLAGTPTYMTRYTVDGANNNMVVGGANNSGNQGFGAEVQKDNMPSTEMLQEFKVSAVGNNAEFMGTGDVTITTKSGTNGFHGSAFEYLQNRDLDATVYGSPTKQAKAWNTFGGSLGGPIFKNKTFFFVDYEGNRKPGSTLIVGSVPTVAMRNGDLNGLTGPAVINPATGAPFPNNQIPASMVNSVATNFLNNYYPAPNFNTGSTANDYRAQVPTPQSTNGYDVRIDQTFGTKNQLFGRWDWKNISATQTNGLLPAQPVPETNRNVTIADTHTFTPNVVNELRFGYSRQIIDESQFPLKGKQVISTLGLQGIDLSGPNLQGNGPFPAIDFSDGTGFTPVQAGTGVAATDRVIQYVDNVSWIKGKHIIKFGGEAWSEYYNRSDSTGYGDDIGWYTFNQGVFSQNAYSDFLLGLPTSNFLWIPPARDSGHTTRAGFFAQDTYRVTSTLTLTFGLRYDLLPQSIEEQGDTEAFLPYPAGTGTMIFPPSFNVPTAILYSINACPGAQAGWNGVPNAPFPCTPVSRNFGARVIQTDYNDWRPRLGVAWRPFGNNKTVLRAGVGLFTVVQTSGGAGFRYAGAAAANYFFYNPTYSAAGVATPTFQWPQTSPYPNLTTSLNPSLIGTYFSYFADPHLKNHPLSQWNVGIERELPANWVLHLNYIGSAAGGLPARVDLDQCYPSAQPYNPTCKPFPNFGQLGEFQNIAFSNYEAFNPALEHRYATGLTLRADYTWAKSLGDQGGEAPTTFDQNGVGPGGITDRFHISDLRGNNPGIPRQRFLLTGVYELPVGRAKPFLSNANAVVDGILGGWRLSTITLVQTGPYLTPTVSCALSGANTNNTGRGQVSCRPDATGMNPNLSNPGPNAPWWNIAAFQPSPPNVGRDGNAGVGTLQGPGTVTIASALSKTFSITERAKLRIEGSFTNLLNHPNFAPPATNISSPSTFGAIVTTQAAENSGNRVGQVSARIDF